MTPTLILLALSIGLGLGLLGGGGSIIAVPILTLFAHFSPKDAVVASLVIVGTAAATGAFGGFIRGLLPIRLAIVVGVSAVAGAGVGGAIGARLPDHIQLAILGAVMIAAALAMWLMPPASARLDHPVRFPLLVGVGIGVGMLTGVVGVGGGFLIVPALLLAARLPMPKASATSLFVIMLSAFAALPNYLSRSTVDWPVVLPFALLAALGTLLGGAAAPRLPQRVLRKAFAVTLVILGSYVLFKA